jgi:hypothetical protein
MKPLSIVLSVAGRKWRGEGRSKLTIVRCKAIWNCHNESSLYNEYIANKQEKKSFILLLSQVNEWNWRT